MQNKMILDGWEVGVYLVLRWVEYELLSDDGMLVPLISAEEVNLIMHNATIV